MRYVGRLLFLVYGLAGFAIEMDTNEKVQSRGHIFALIYLLLMIHIPFVCTLLAMCLRRAFTTSKAPMQAIIVHL